MGHIELWPEGEYYLQIPKHFFEDCEYFSLSVHAKMLYGILLDRMHLSCKNEWFDGHGEIFIYYSVQNVAKALNCCKEKAINTLRELENVKLITRVKKGQGKQDMIYVHAFKRITKPLLGWGFKFDP